MKYAKGKTRIITILCAMVLATSCIAMSACSSAQNDEERGTSSTVSTASNSSESSLVVPAEETGPVTNQDVSVTSQETVSSSTNNGGGNNGGSTTTTPTTSSSTTPTQPSNPTTSTPATPSTPTTSTPSTTSSTPSQSTPDPEPTPEPTPEPDPEPVRERTIDPQYICDQVNARMGEVGMQNAVDAVMAAGYSREEAFDSIYGTGAFQGMGMGWYTITRSLYENNNAWQINSTMESLRNQHNQNNIQYAWMEVQCYLDASYNEVSSIDDAEYVRFITYR